MILTKVFLLFQILILGCSAATVSEINDAFAKVGDTLKTYSELSISKKVSEVNKGLSAFSKGLSAMTGPIGAITAFIQLGTGSAESWQ